MWAKGRTCSRPAAGPWAPLTVWHMRPVARHAHVPAHTAVQDHPSMLPLQITGQVMSAASNMVRVDVDTILAQAHHKELPQTQLLCSLRSLLKKLNQTVVVGDRVRMGTIDWRAGKAQVEHVFPRASQLTDPSVANVDFALLVFALANPPFEEVQVSRFLVYMEASGLPFRLLFNKADLVPPEVLAQRVQQVRSWGYEPIVASCESGLGMDEAVAALAGKTSVVAGPSGAGKSSLINAMRMGRHRRDVLPPARFHPGVRALGGIPLALRFPQPAPESDTFYSIAANGHAQGAADSLVPGTAVSSGSGNADSLDMGQASSEIQAYPGGEVPPTGERCMKLQAVGEGQQEESSVVFGAAGSSDQLEGVQEGTHFSNQGSGDTRGAGGQGSSRYQHTGTAEGQEQGGPEAAVNLPLLAQAEGGESGDSGLVRTGTAETPVAAGEQGSVGVAGVQGSGGSGGGGGMQGGRGKEGGQGGQGSAGVKGPGFLTVGELSHMGRGMHTTTCVTLIPLEGGARLADTPGFSQPSLEYVASQELSSLFPEFVAAQQSAGGCRFNDCMHKAEPGCAITAVQPPFERYPLYLKCLTEIKEREDTDVRVMQAGKRAREGVYKVKLEKGGQSRSEARLDAGKHRRTSRTKAKQDTQDMWKAE